MRGPGTTHLTPVSAVLPARSRKLISMPDGRRSSITPGSALLYSRILARCDRVVLPAISIELTCGEGVVRLVCNEGRRGAEQIEDAVQVRAHHRPCPRELFVDVAQQHVYALEQVRC